MQLERTDFMRPANLDEVKKAILKVVPFTGEMSWDDIEIFEYGEGLLKLARDELEREGYLWRKHRKRVVVDTFWYQRKIPKKQPKKRELSKQHYAEEFILNRLTKHGRMKWEELKDRHHGEYAMKEARTKLLAEGRIKQDGDEWYTDTSKLKTQILALLGSPIEWKYVRDSIKAQDLERARSELLSEGRISKIVINKVYFWQVNNGKAIPTTESR